MNRVSFLVLYLFLVSCDDLCGNELIQEATSPDGDYVASVFERNCGATTQFIRGVSIRSSEDRFDPDDFDRWVFSTRGQPKLEVSWQGEKHLKVTLTGFGDVSRQKTEWDGVSISYD